MLLSVLLTTYNAVNYLSDAIGSILNQTFKNFELVIVDDGSTDSTELLVKKINDPRINYIRIPHMGRSKALNYGMQNCNYDWIALMDADDISHPKRLEKQIEIIKKRHLVDWISNWHATFIEKLIDTIKLPEDSMEIRENLILSNSICFASSVFRKRIVLDAGGFEGSVFEDYNLLLKIKDKCNFYNIQEVLYFNRKRKNSHSRKNYEKIKSIIYKIQDPYYQELQSEFNLKNIFEENYYRGWREFAYGKKKTSRKYWNKLGIKIIFYPKALIGWVFSLMPDKYFFYFRKLGINLVLFYSPFVSSDVKSTFQNILKGNSKSI
ncbi:MAG: hypothetical protein DRI95_12785 [Bacteroidetes bacterium]|nr:MAG: hypothetical protein DRI95_12785 [Bacteroidota bacterium]